MLQKIQMHLKVAHRGMTLKKQFQRKRKNFGLKLMFDIYLLPTQWSKPDVKISVGLKN